VPGPLGPLIDALRTLARTTARNELADLLGPARRGLGRLLPELDAGAALAQDRGAEPAADGIQVSQLLELVLGLLGRLSARRPLLLVLEDLHWSDQPRGRPAPSRYPSQPWRTRYPLARVGS
jgi:predicted ATPase